MLDGSSIITLSFWVAICAAAPELIWRGACVAVDHLSLADIYSALLIGTILAFFVEPMMERMRALVGRSPTHVPRHPLFTASIGLAFALVAVCLHDAMRAYLSQRSDGSGLSGSGLEIGITQAVDWAAVPFTITAAWLSARRRCLAVPTGIIACAATYVTGKVFGWTDHEILTTIVPCLLILGLGYRRMLGETRGCAVSRCAQAVALLAIIWLVMALVVDTTLDAFGLGRFDIYDASDFWMDVRFYLGWVIGLLLAPHPHPEIFDLAESPASMFKIRFNRGPRKDTSPCTHWIWGELKRPTNAMGSTQETVP